MHPNNEGEHGHRITLFAVFIALASPLLSYLWKHLRNLDDANETLGDAAVRLAKIPYAKEPIPNDSIQDRRHAENFVWQVVRYTLYDALRQQNPEILLDLPDEFGDEDSSTLELPSHELPPDLAAELHEIDEQSRKQWEYLIERAQAILSKSLWEAFDIIEVQGMEYTRAAKQLRISVDALHKRMSRARRQLQGQLGDEFFAS